MPTFVQILDFVGTFAFAISGIRLASAKRFDWFGAYVVGFATAVGGGTLRDLLLDVTPGWMTDPIYLICTGLALIFVTMFGKHLIHLNNTFFFFDTIGLALFTVVGVGKSLSLGYPFWVAIIMGSMTGAAGGVIRDVFINEIPLIFRKEIYAVSLRYRGFPDAYSGREVQDLPADAVGACLTREKQNCLKIEIEADSDGIWIPHQVRDDHHVGASFLF